MWYCWKILLKESSRARKIHEMSFVSDGQLDAISAERRAKVGLWHYLKTDAAMNSITVRIERLGPYESIHEAAEQKDISLV